MMKACIVISQHAFSAIVLSTRRLPPASTIRMTICDICDGVNSEYQFVHDAIPFHLLGMNAGLVYQYIDFCAYRLMLVTLQY
jgi:ribonucleotide reductase beta subunit family protein with ferritin-like domain